MAGLVRSAGLLPYRIIDGLEVMIAHPGGPWFAGRDEGSWSIVKGIVKSKEDERSAARREFKEETGWKAPTEHWLELGETVLRSRKVVVAWAIEKTYDPDLLDPGMFQMHGKSYPEIDRVEWFRPNHAKSKLNPSQNVFVDRLEQLLRLNGD